MSEIKIYTAGAMKGLTFDEYYSWRKRLQWYLSNGDTTYKFFHPPEFYNYEQNLHKSEREVKEFELNQLRQCDVMVVNLANIESSIGTHMELGYVNAVNSFGGKHIYVIGFGENEVHPWIEDSLFRREKNVADTAEYIKGYFI